MNLRLIFGIIFMWLGFQLTTLASQTINVTISNLKTSTNGTVLIAVFGDEQSFKSEKALFYVDCDKKDFYDGRLTVKIPVEAGVYGLSVLDDENGSGKMEYNFLGIPKEGFGFSNFSLKKMRKPKFNDFAFEITNKEVKDIQVVLKYF